MTTTLASGTHDTYLAAFERLQTRLASEPARLRDTRRAAMDRFAELGFPTRRWEEWRSTPVDPVVTTTFRAPALFDVAAAEVERLDHGGPRVVVVNGRFARQLSRLDGLPEGVAVCSLAQAFERHTEVVESHLARYAAFEQHPFVALNTALMEDGVFIHVPRGVVVEQPVSMLFVGRTEAEPTVTFPRLLVLAEESAEIRLVEQWVTVGDGRTLVGPVTEIVAGANAKVDHYKVERESTQALHLATLQVWQDRASTVSSHSISWGGALVRNDVNAVLDGEGCEATLNGLYLVEGDQLVDNHMRVEHVKAHCVSHELYKGILEGRGRAVFNGRIFVHKGAQKTDAKQTNRNLLLSKDALVQSNPQLEIFADDVRCTHGSTVGQLDADAVFYLRSRGIGEEAARSLLTYAFAADIVERIRVAPVRRNLEEFLFRRLPKGDIVRQAV